MTSTFHASFQGSLKYIAGLKQEEAALDRIILTIVCRVMMTGA
jgi:hypothetical protein